jgi:hypothetical protein
MDKILRNEIMIINHFIVAPILFSSQIRSKLNLLFQPFWLLHVLANDMGIQLT